MNVKVYNSCKIALNARSRRLLSLFFSDLQPLVDEDGVFRLRMERPMDVNIEIAVNYILVSVLCN
jgi:putative component of toxin-antitoxin plasmid stabilization module